LLTVILNEGVVKLVADQTLTIEEKNLLAQAARERAEIVDKYDRVRFYYNLKSNDLRSII